MVEMKEVIKKAEEFALSEIEKYGLPPKFLFLSASEHGLRLAKKLKVDENIVSIGLSLMDIKLGETTKQGKSDQHVKFGAEASRIFLSKYNLPQEGVNKIINCVKGHHKDVPWICKEAEVAANADCYKFLLLKNWLKFLSSLSKREMSFEDALKYAEAKADEKWSILSLDICKKELESDYKLIKEICSRSK